MKQVRTFNTYNNGDQSRVNIYFEDGTQFCKTISAHDAMRIAKEGESVLEEIIVRYSNEEDKKPSVNQITQRGEHIHYTDVNSHEGNKTITYFDELLVLARFADDCKENRENAIQRIKYALNNLSMNDKQRRILKALVLMLSPEYEFDFPF